MKRSYHCPFNSSHQLQPMATAEKECTLISITKSSKDHWWQPIKISVESRPVPKPRTWLEVMRNKELAATRYRDAHLQQVCAAKASGTPFVPEQDYCPACTSIDKKYSNEFPGCPDWEDTESE